MPSPWTAISTLRGKVLHMCTVQCNHCSGESVRFNLFQPTAVLSVKTLTRKGGKLPCLVILTVFDLFRIAFDPKLATSFDTSLIQCGSLHTCAGVAREPHTCFDWISSCNLFHKTETLAQRLGMQEKIIGNVTGIQMVFLGCWGPQTNTLFTEKWLEGMSDNRETMPK